MKELNTLTDTKLRKYLPKGKLRGMTQKQKTQKVAEEVEEVPMEEEVPKEVKVVPVAPKPEGPRQVGGGMRDLDELEGQLRDIEGQLRSLK